MTKVLRQYTHEDGRACTLYETPSGPRWMYKSGSAALESVGITQTPYADHCDREHPED